MNVLLKQMEQCLYDLKHTESMRESRIKSLLSSTELALEDLIRAVEQYEKDKKDNKSYLSNNKKEQSIIIYVLEWGIDICYSSTVQFVNTTVFSTIEDACSKAIEYKENVPNIIKYDLENRKVLHEWHDIPALDVEIGTL